MLSVQPMNVKQFRYSPDNLSYLIFGKDLAVAIDGGAAEAILAFIADKGLNLKYVTNTHAHADHTVGNQRLLDGSGAVFIDNNTLRKNRFFELEGARIVVLHTPGHTLDSVTFHLDNTLITGDTLFNGTVGNCFSGDLQGFYRSIKMLMAFPGETVIYAGHDYVSESMAFAGAFEPGNRHIDAFWENYDPTHVQSTLHEEFKVNPYLRFNDENIGSILGARGLPVASEYERWASMMSVE